MQNSLGKYNTDVESLPRKPCLMVRLETTSVNSKTKKKKKKWELNFTMCQKIHKN